MFILTVNTVNDGIFLPDCLPGTAVGVGLSSVPVVQFPIFADQVELDHMR